MPVRRFSLLVLLAAACSLGLAAEARYPKSYDLEHVKWQLSIDDVKGTIAGEVTNTVRITADGATEVIFDCEKLLVSRVFVGETGATFTHRDNWLTVRLPSPQKRGSKLNVRILYTGTPEAGIYFIPAERAFPSKTGMVYTQGQMTDTRCWIPTYDWPDDKATSEGIVTVRPEFTTLSNGVLLGTKQERGMKTFHWKMDKPHSTYLISLLAGEYTKVSETWRGRPVDYYVPPGLEPSGKASFGGTPVMVEYFSKLTGVDYPYPKFAQAVVADYMYGGMENITAVTNTINTLFHPSSAPLESSAGLVAHELAHQWFGDTVTCTDWSHSWLNEGFATLLPLFWTRHTEGVDEFDIDRQQVLTVARFAMRGEPRPMVTTNYNEPFDMFDGHAFQGGAARLLMLMNMVGEKKFWNGVKDFVNAYKFKSADTDQFFASMSKSTGVNLDQFKKQWFHTPAIPKMVAYIDGTDLQVEQTSEPYFQLDIPVAILDNGKWVHKTLKMTGADARLPLGDLAGKPFLLDPEGWLLAEITYKDTNPAHNVELFRHLKTAAGKHRLLNSLDAAGAATLVELAKAEKSPSVLQRLIGHLPAEATSELLEFTKHPDIRVVNSAVNRLAALPATDASTTRLRDLYMSSPNQRLQINAYRGLLRHTNDETVARRGWMTPSFDDGFRSASLQWLGTNRRDEARELALEVLQKKESETLRVQSITLLGRLKDKPNERRVFDALMAVARERSFTARTAALNALAAYGDKSALEDIEPLTNHSMHFVKQTALAASARLKG